jgi:uncharacterized protein YukE
MPDIAGGLIRVPQDYGDTGPSLVSLAQTIEAELSDLKSKLARFVGGVDWQGYANVNYADLQTRWDQAADDLLNSALTTIGQTATVNWQNHVDTESANTRTWAH